MTISNDIALLAPVPLEHLQTGKDICLQEGKLAFGSNAFETFLTLDKVRDGSKVAVYIYASHAPDPTLQVSWKAIYTGHVESIGGAHPDGMKYRPPSTMRYLRDNSGHWGVFWEVEELEELSDANRIWIAELESWKTKQRLAKNYLPEGPIPVSWRSPDLKV